MQKTKYLTERCRYLEKEMAKIEAATYSSPDGALVTKRKNAKEYYYYCWEGNELRPLLSEEDHELAKKLALKKLCSSCRKPLKAELGLVKRLLKNGYDYEAAIEKFYMNHPGFRRLLTNDFKTISKRKEEAVKNLKTDEDYFTDGRKIPTLRGDKVRSKSEALIANLLFKNGITYVYEPLIVINGIRFHPDFLIINDSDGKFKIWEHFGMIESDDYFGETLSKIKVYDTAGYRLGNDLIATFETKDTPLHEKEVVAMIEKYF